MTGSAPLLLVEGLTVEFAQASGWQAVVEDVGFDVAPGEVVAIVGESGSGKSVSSLAVMRLLPERASRVRADRIEFDGRDLLALSEDEMRTVRGGDIAMIFQEPMTSLNPVIHRREPDRRSRAHPPEGVAQVREGGARSRCSNTSAFPTRTDVSRATRTSSRAACASAP